MENKPKRIYKGDKVALYLPEGFKPTELGIKNLHREYYAGSKISKFDTTEKMKKAKRGGLVQKVEKQDKINAKTALSYERAKQGKEKPQGVDLSINKLHKLYNLTSGKPMTLAQFRTRAKRRSFQKTLRQLATHQF